MKPKSQPYRWQCAGLLMVPALVVALACSHRRTAAPHRESAFLRSTASLTAASSDEVRSAKLQAAFAKLPLHFEANRGQADPEVKFLAQGNGCRLALTATEALLTWCRPAVETSVLRMKLIGANPQATVSGLEKLPCRVNYFVGNDPRQWHTNVPAYAKVRYRSVYPGIDLLYYGNPEQLEYDFIVAPDANPRQVVLAFEGADRLEVDRQGDLVLHAAGGQVRQQKPRIYQEVDGVRRPIPGGYVLQGKGRVGFHVGKYDPARPLVIDPVFVFDYFSSTFFGGPGDDHGKDIAVVSTGDVYVTGRTANPLPTAPDNVDAFVGKFNPITGQPIYFQYIGGTGLDRGQSIAVDSLGAAYIAGTTQSTNFAVTPGVFQGTSRGGADAFATKINPTGTGLAYSTYLGGSGIDWGNAIAIDGTRNAYVTGDTESSDLFRPGSIPVMGDWAGSGMLWGPSDAFVAKVNPTGTALAYASYYGGSGADSGEGIAVNPTGDAYVTGWSRSATVPAGNTLQPTNHGESDAFIFKLRATPTINAARIGLEYAALLGDTGADEACDIAINNAGSAYVTGFYTNPARLAAGARDAFVASYGPTGSLVSFIGIGGSGTDMGNGIAVGSTGNAYVTGQTNSADFVLVNPRQARLGGGQDAFVAKVNAGGAGLGFCTYLGGSGDDRGKAIALHEVTLQNIPQVRAWFTGGTRSSNLLLVRPIQPMIAGGEDVFLSGFSE